MNGSILLVLGCGSNDRASTSPSSYRPSEDAAFAWACRTGSKIVVLQILNSKLYHWGHTDPIVPGQGRDTFIRYIREQTLLKGLRQKKDLMQRAAAEKVLLEIETVESENPDRVILREAVKEFDRIFIPRERKKLFPVLQRSLAQRLKSKSIPNVVVC